MSSEGNPLQSVELSEAEKIARLREVLRPIFVEGYSTLGHGTDLALAPNILKEGLRSKSAMLGSTAIALFDSTIPYDEQPDEYFRTILNWPHRSYKGIVVVMIPNKDTPMSANRYFDSAVEELETDDTSALVEKYIIPAGFIKGFIDAKSLSFVENPNYDPKRKVQIKPFPIIDQESGKIGIAKTDSEALPVQPRDVGINDIF